MASIDDVGIELDMQPNEMILYSAIIGMASLCVLIGSFKSLTEKTTETMSASDAWMFPLVGSCVLFGLFMLFRLFSKEYVNMVLTAYFLLFGVTAVTGTISDFFQLFVGKQTDEDKALIDAKIKIPFMSEPVHVWITMLDLVSFVIAVAIGVWYVMTKHWIANNIFGISFSIQGVALISIGSYKVGCILLSGLFFYDIFWVFGTDVMVTVAKSFDAPIKVLWPRDLWAETYEFSLLGLGDIVIPGVFVALLLRFDAHRADHAKSFSKVYFWCTYLAYVFGLVLTIGVMHVYKHAQPALLYLVPCCMGASFATGAIRGELSQLFAYTEEVPESEEAKEGEEGKDSSEGKNSSEGKKEDAGEVADEDSGDESKKNK
eukprot:TRINITY_DN24238_c0_g1_i1.p1 TRINITY_DN24238_c0_g1~~TRINITY_DN24238_c0_g1_i1.p1  ORF type:complete len:401 (+),score=115.56 TRINITY_DN24238_c0_g1_i1:82-1203(+)